MTSKRTPDRDFDAQMMAMAVRMARRGLGTTAFNPSVGAVIADEATGEVIARGWTQPGGRPHAEKEALRRAGARARGKTMYVTLEPCAHTGRVPTCADAVQSSGLSRVVVALVDPNPVIAGRGLEQLRATGVSVDVGVLAEAAQAVTHGHILHVTSGRPFVQLKLALSADGLIAPGTGAPVWVTGPEARAAGHLLRAQADLIATGIGTILADDPELTCRLPGLAARSPDRLIFDTHLRIPDTARVLQQPGRAGAVFIACGRDAAQSGKAAGLRKAERVSAVIDCGAAPVTLAAALAALRAKPIRRVLIEAGPRLSRHVIEADLADEVVLFRGRSNLGRAGIAPLDGLSVDAIGETRSWQRASHRQIGADEVSVYRRLRP